MSRMYIYLPYLQRQFQVMALVIRKMGLVLVNQEIPMI